MNSLLSKLPDETTPAVIVVKPERPVSNTGRPMRSRADPNLPTYNPGMVYILELATILTLRDNESIGKLGENLTASLQNIIRDAKNLHPLVVSRAVYYFLTLLRLSYVSLFSCVSHADKMSELTLELGISFYACACCPTCHIQL